MPNIVYAQKTTMFSEETVNPDGSRTAGRGQVTWFAMELLDENNKGFWSTYCKTMAKGAGRTYATAIKGFENALDLASTQVAHVYVVYALLDLDYLRGIKPELEDDDVQMCMTLTTGPTDDFFAVTHMGIFRNPSISKEPERLGKLASTRISIELHSFAAQALARFRPRLNPAFMITAPMDHMAGLFDGHGKLLLREVDSGASSSGASSDSGSSSGSGSASARHNTYEMVGERADRELTIRTSQNVYETSYYEEPWLFNLAFNKSHAFAPAFIDYPRLRLQNGEMTLMER